MICYFSRISFDISKHVKLKILLRNISPFYQNQLSLVNVVPIVELRRLGKRLEASKEAVQDYVPPSRKTSVLEPDLAYIKSSPSVDSCEMFTSVTSGPSQTISNKVMAKGCLVKANKF